MADEKSSYSMGLSFGNQMHNSGLEHAVSMDAVIRGLKDGLDGKPVTAEDKDRAIQLMRVGRDAIGAHNHAAASEFLAKNTTVAGVTTTPSGLQYTVFSPGDAKAAAPAGNDQVTVNYRGRLLDGTEFDNSDSHSQPARFSLAAGVIKGWHEALVMMKPGAKWRLFIPPALAYDNYSPPTIPPGSLLIFDIELLKVESHPAMSPPGAMTPGAKPPATHHAPPKRAVPAPLAQ